MSDERPWIELEEDGPIVVHGLKRLTGPGGDPLRARTMLVLCRCGGSGRKPFCDMTHEQNGFSSAPGTVPEEDRVDRYEGDEVTILDNRRACSHAGSCVARVPSVWGVGSPWIDPNGADAQTIIDQVRRCPSGALTYEVNGEPGPELEREPEIRIVRNGPYNVRGGIELRGVAFPKGVSRERYSLCRCGRSRTKPFCDGSHMKTGFAPDDPPLTIARSRDDAENPA